MPNPKRGEVAVTIDGEKRVLKYPLDALAVLQEELQLDDANDLLKVKFDNFRNVKYFLWAGLLWRQPDLTVDEVGQFEVELSPLVDAIATALVLAVFGRVDPPRANPRKPGAKTSDLSIGTKSDEKPSPPEFPRANSGP